MTPADWRALDGTLYIDEEGLPWMVFCHEWEQIVDGTICAVRLSEDLSRAEGDPVTLFKASDAPWVDLMEFGGKKGLITDGPWLHRNEDGSLLMLWSSFGKGADYMTAAARSASGKITGPWDLSAPALFTEDGGHAMMFETFDGKRVLSLHKPNKHPFERAHFLEIALKPDGVTLEDALFPTIIARGGAPTPEQIAWHEMEQQMFLCLDPCTWQGREYDDHSTPLEDMNPARLDTEQWCEAAKSFGAKQILFVAKHTGGFCWWPTETTEYCVRNIPWKDGKGDVLGDLAASCRRHGLKLGVYIYPGDDQWGAGIGSGGKTSDPAKQEAYNQVLRQQWTEVLTRYGEISELWFDGSCVVELSDILRQYAPKAMVFQGPCATLRWPGNEQGIAPDPAWQTVSRADALSGVATGAHSNPDGDAWLPMEMDTTLLDHKWFWGPGTDSMIKPLDKLMDIYLKSVGRGCVLLLNATPDTSGLIPETHLARYREFGAAIQRLYANKKGETHGEGTSLNLRFDAPTAVTHVVIREDIRRGHAVREFRIDGCVNGKWRRLAKGESVGYKRIETFDKVEVTELHLRITRNAATPDILQFAAYESSTLAGTAPVPDANAWIPVDAWNAVPLSGEWQTVEVDLTPVVRRPGEYLVKIAPLGDGGSLETADAVLLIAGVEDIRHVAPLEQPGIWRIQRTDQVTDDEKGRTALRFRVRVPAGASMKSEMRIREVTP